MSRRPSSPSVKQSLTVVLTASGGQGAEQTLQNKDLVSTAASWVPSVPANNGMVGRTGSVDAPENTNARTMPAIDTAPKSVDVVPTITASTAPATITGHKGLEGHELNATTYSPPVPASSADSSLNVSTPSLPGKTSQCPIVPTESSSGANGRPKPLGLFGGRH